MRREWLASIGFPDFTINENKEYILEFEEE